MNALETDRPVARSFYDWCGSTVAIDYATSFGTFRVSPRSFFQVNRFLIENLVDAALQNAAGKTALDLYAGVGLFALPLAARFEHVIAVESGISAARDLEVKRIPRRSPPPTRTRQSRRLPTNLRRNPRLRSSRPPSRRPRQVSSSATRAPSPATHYHSVLRPRHPSPRPL